MKRIIFISVLLTLISMCGFGQGQRKFYQSNHSKELREKTGLTLKEIRMGFMYGYSCSDEICPYFYIKFSNNTSIQKRRWTPNLVYRLKRNGVVIDSTYYFKEKVSPAIPNVTYLERRALNKMAFVDENDITGYTIEFFFAEIEDIPNTSPSRYLYRDIIKIDEIPISKINFHLSESDFRIYDPRLRRYVYFDIPLNKL